MLAHTAVAAVWTAGGTSCLTGTKTIVQYVPEEAQRIERRVALSVLGATPAQPRLRLRLRPARAAGARAITAANLLAPLVWKVYTTRDKPAVDADAASRAWTLRRFQVSHLAARPCARSSCGCRSRDSLSLRAVVRTRAGTSVWFCQAMRGDAQRRGGQEVHQAASPSRGRLAAHSSLSASWLTCADREVSGLRPRAASSGLPASARFCCE